MNREPRFDHPAHRDDLIQTLRRSPDGEDVAEGLEYLFNKALPFDLNWTPTDEWDYVKGLIRLLAERGDLCDLAFDSPSDAFGSGAEMGEAVARHGERI